MTAMMNLIQGMAINSPTLQSGQINAISQNTARCVTCNDGHAMEDCPQNPQSVYFVKNNPFSNTYNPRWRNHPNFSWMNQ